MPPRRRSFDAVVRAAESVLKACHVDHVFVGAIAVVAFGRNRTTSDLGVIARFRVEDAASLAEGFRRRGFLASEEDIRDSLAEPAHCTIEDSRSTYRIDLVPATGAAAEHSMRKRRWVRWRGRLLPVASPEHTVVMKIRFGSEQDLEDAISILASQTGKLDAKEMREFARQQGVLGALRAMRRKARAFERERC